MFIFIFLIAILGVLWFLNLVVLLVKLKGNKSIQNQTILGAVLTFLLIGLFMCFLFAVIG